MPGPRRRCAEGFNLTTAFTSPLGPFLFDMGLFNRKKQGQSDTNGSADPDARSDTKKDKSGWRRPASQYTRLACSIEAQV